MPDHHIAISVTFRETHVSVETQNIASLRAYVQNDILYVSGLTEGQPWYVFNSTGILIYASPQPPAVGAGSARPPTTCPLPASGIYIVTDGISVVKVIN